MSRFQIVSLLVLIIITAGCGRAINRSAERRIRDILPTALGPARQYLVHVENPPDQTVQGRLSSITIDGDDVQFPGGLLLDHLSLHLKDVDIDTGHRTLRGIGSTDFTAILSETSLDEYLAGESPAGETLRRLRVTLGDHNLATVAGERVTLGAGVPFRVTGPLRLAGPSRVEFDPTHLSIIGIPLPQFVVNFLKRRVASALDLSSLPIPIQLSSFQTSPGKIILVGSASSDAIMQHAREGH